MAEKSLKARIAVVGGRELVDLFDKIGDTAKKAMHQTGESFNRVDIAAKKAQKDVVKLEKELKALDRISRDVRAKIKVDKKTGPTADQKAALAFAEAADQRAATIRRQLNNTDDVLATGKGTALQALFEQGNKDQFKIVESAKEMQAVIDDVRAKGGFGGLIDNDQLDRVEAVFERLNVGQDDVFKGFETHLAKAEAETKAAAEAMANPKKSVADMINEERLAKANGGSVPNSAAADAAAEKKAADAAEDFNAKLKAMEKKHKEERAADRAKFSSDLKKMREDFAAKQANLRADLQAERDSWKAGVDEAEDKFRAASDKQGEIYNGRLAKDREAAKKDRATRFRDMSNSLDKERVKYQKFWGTYKKEAAEASAKHLEATMKIKGGLRDVEGAFIRTSKAASGFHLSAGAFTGFASTISKTLSTAARDIGRFGNALKQLESAIGNTALRAGIVGLVGALGAGLAALGGAAALGGLAAIAGLSAFNAAALKKDADTVGQALDNFTATKYVAGSNGIPYEDYVKGMEELQKTMIGVAQSTEDAAEAKKLWQKYNLPLYSSDGKGFVDPRNFFEQLAEITKNMPKAVRIDFLAKLGLDKTDGLSWALPMLLKGGEDVRKRYFRAVELGVVLDDSDIAKFEELRLQFYDLGQMILGLGYKFSKAVMPTLMPVLKAIEDWVVKNQDLIVNGLTAAFNWLLQVATDFFHMWQTWYSGGDPLGIEVTHKWTQTFIKGISDVKTALVDFWGKISAGYDKVKGPLTKVANFFGFSSPITLGLTYLGAQFLGLSNLAISFARVGTTALAAVGNVALNTLTPALKGGYKAVDWLTTGLFGISAWPVLLVAGLAGIYFYWDEIVATFQWAWGEFKKTFPETAKWLEDSFNTGLALVKSFTGSSLAEFNAKFPQIGEMFNDVKAAALDLLDSIKAFDWGPLLDLGKTVGTYMIDNLIDSIKTLTPLLDYLVTNTLKSMKEILEGIGAAMRLVRYYGNESGKRDYEVGLSPREFAAKTKTEGVGETGYGQSYADDAYRQQAIGYYTTQRDNYNRSDDEKAKLNQIINMLTAMSSLDAMNWLSTLPSDKLGDAVKNVIGTPSAASSPWSLFGKAQPYTLFQPTLPAAPQSALAGANPAADPGQKQPILFQIDTGTVVNMSTSDPNLPQLMAEYNRTKNSNLPSWKR